MERREFLRISAISAAYIATKPVLDLFRSVPLIKPEVFDQKPPEITYDDAMSFLTEISNRLHALPKKQFIHTDAELRDFAMLLVPLYKYLGLTMYEGPVRDIHFQPFTGKKRTSLFARTDCQNGTIAVNNGFIDPNSLLNGRPNLGYVIAHELDHAIGQICVEYDTGDPYAPPPNTETTPTLVGLEVLAYLTKKNNEAAFYGLLGGLQEVADRTLFYVLLRDNRANDYIASITEATHDALYIENAKALLQEITDHPYDVEPLYHWSQIYGNSVFWNLQIIEQDPNAGTTETYMFNPQYKTLYETPLRLPYLSAALRNLDII